jgi:hypothetical protein
MSAIFNDALKKWFISLHRLNNKMKNIKYHTVGTIPKANIKIVERGKINTPNTQIHDLAWYSHFNQIITSFMGSNLPSL